MDEPFAGHDEKRLKDAIKEESTNFEKFYLWLEESMPWRFFDHIDNECITAVVHNLLNFPLQNYFSQIHLKSLAIVLCLDSTDADVRILQHYRMHGIKHYRAFVSRKPFIGCNENLRIATIFFTETVESTKEDYPLKNIEELRLRVKKFYPDVTDEEFEKLRQGVNTRFLNSLSLDRLTLALTMYFRAQTSDYCQYEVGYNVDWQANNRPSLDIILAWRNTPKYNFLYRLALMVQRHGLVMRRVNATYVNPYHKDNVLILGLRLHGSQGQAAWDAADVKDFVKELVTLKYFQGFDIIEDTFVHTGLLSGNLGNLLRAIVTFVHQVLVHADVHQYSFENVQDALCRHPELIVELCKAFKYKFDPENCNLDKYQRIKEKFLSLVQRLDTGQEDNNILRRNVLRQAFNFIEYTLKTNFYRQNKTGLAFRLDPHYLEHGSFNRHKHFPELPYAIFFIKGAHFFGFHIRFKDLARGGLRTIFPDKFERMVSERKSVFTECYNLSYTQHKKNKDIPEGGAKGVIFLEPYEGLVSEAQILRNELCLAGECEEEIKSIMDTFIAEHSTEYLYHAQRTFIESFLSLINCYPDGTLITKNVADYFKKPEYIYLGPDELMHDSMIEWINGYSQHYGYRPGRSFITGQPGLGINHKHYGVTSLGVNVYMHHVLEYLGINPYTDTFTVKMTGGPDGDVAGNQIRNLYKHYPDTAKLLAITDGSGTIYDPNGLNLKILTEMFDKVLPIGHYPLEELSDESFLLKLHEQRDTTPYLQQMLCLRKKEGKIVEDWLSSSEANYLYRNNVHQVVVDVFIPGGGRPRTLHDENYVDYLDDRGKPTSKAIIEGANLYLTPWARKKLENLGVLIIKDSSANKAGVICSSFEVLCGLILTEEEFLEEKSQLVKEILQILHDRAYDEVQLILSAHDKTKKLFSDISDRISSKINKFTDQLLDYLETRELSRNQTDPFIQCLINYCPPAIRNKYQQRLLERIPMNHIKAIIASRIASMLVYKKGLDWYPSIIDILPLILQDIIIMEK